MRENFANFEIFLILLIVLFYVIAVMETWLTADISFVFIYERLSMINLFRNRYGCGISVFL